MTGIEALVRLPILQHQRDIERGLNTAGFISGYRGSPLGGIDQAIWKAQQYLKQHNIMFQPGVNEDLAATAVWGSQQVNLFEGGQYDGVFGMWYGKGPGVDRSMDAIKHANAAGTAKYGGVLAIAGDDHACKSSTLPHQSEHAFIGASIPVLSPSNVQEVLDLGIYGWELSRYCGSWVALKAVTENMDSAISADINPNRVTINYPDQFELPKGGVHIRLEDNPLDQEERLNKYKIYAAREFARVNHLNRIVIDSAKARLGIITTGKAYLDVLEALTSLGIDESKASAIGLRVYKVGMNWPLEPVGVQEFAKDLEEILVVEEKRSILEDQLTGQLYNWLPERRPRVVGEFDGQGGDLLSNLHELTPAQIAKAIASRLSRFYQDDNIDKKLDFYQQKERSLAQAQVRLERRPHYCSGCPHSTSTQVPEGSRALGGIGCHYMGTWKEGDRKAYTFTHMGGEGVSWVGQAPFTDTKHVFQNLGDGTYFHSGLLAIRQSVSSKVNITYKLLYNDAVAMTGGQPVDGELSIEKIIYQLYGEGVQRIALISDFPKQYKGKLPKIKGLSLNHRDQLIAIEKELREISGTTVIIYEQTCAAEKRRRRKKGLLEDPARRVFINPSLCEGCGDCSKESHCLSVLPLETELGRKRKIDQNACNKDYSCLKGFCPSFITVVGGRLKNNASLSIDKSFPKLSDPILPPIKGRPWNIVVTGIGGTGVLTVTALVAMAAHIEGKGCATMNQTGLAQKFGAVVSHVRISISQKAIHAVRIPTGDADVLLGCDLVVASSDESMAKVNIDRSHAVINDYENTTADFITNADVVFPAESMKQIIKEGVGENKVNLINATDLATNLLNDPIASNVLLLGYAYQQGLVPVSAESIIQAIELNAVSVDLNKKAFTWGRRTAQNLQSVLDAVTLTPAHKPLDSLEDIVSDRYQRLVDYQNTAYAQQFKVLVERVKTVENKKIANNKHELAIAVAKYYFKLMAYKDEYEVARLYTNGVFQKQLDATFEGDYRLEFHLAAPVLAKKNPDTGLPAKRQLPQMVMLIFKMLAPLKILRGTIYDVFGYSSERKLERQLINDYEVMVDEIIEKLTLENYSVAVALASSPDKIRGYGHIKQKNVHQSQIYTSQLLQSFRNQKMIRAVDVATPNV